MEKMDILYIVMPAYNEEANIENVVNEWYKLLEDKSPESRLVIADAGSTDRTHEILLEQKIEKKQLVILTDSDRQHGPKVIALYDYAIKNGADYIFQTDSDGQTSADEFENFWENRNSYSGIFGYRTKRGDGASRAFVEKIVCILLKLYFGVNVPDANAPFRLMKADCVKKYLYKIPQDYNIPNIMMTTYFAKYESNNIKFNEISFKPRQGGKNSINISKIIKIGWKAVGDFHNFRANM